MRRSSLYYLVKTNRITGWILFVLVSVYLVTGFALCGNFGFNFFINSQRALRIHQVSDWPLVVVFLLHSLASTTLAFRRWGWIRPKKRARALVQPRGG